VVPARSRLLAYHLPTMRQMLWLCQRGVVSTLRYHPGTYDGSVTLLRTAGHTAEGEHRALLGWDTVSTGAVRVHAIPGNHLTLLRHPHIVEVANVIQTVLDESMQPS
jgi:thioesterase domain-containing protein